MELTKSASGKIPWLPMSPCAWTAKEMKAESPQEQERDDIVLWRSVIAAPENETDAVEGRAMRRDEGVGELGGGAESRQPSIKRQPDPIAGCVAQGEEARLGGRLDPAIGRHVLDGALKVRDGDCGIIRGGVLVGSVLNPIARQFLPVARPVGAKRA